MSFELSFGAASVKQRISCRKVRRRWPLPSESQNFKFAPPPTPSIYPTPSKISIQDFEPQEFRGDTGSSNLQLIEISRILKGTPQSPHFLNLRRFSQLSRKNLICAWDRTFEETVDRISILRVENFWINACELWTALGELHSLGYHVVQLRRRVVELSDVMAELRVVKTKAWALREKAEGHRMERCRVEGEILSLKAKAEREESCAEEVMKRVGEVEKELPTLNGRLERLAPKPFGSQSYAP